MLPKPASHAAALHGKQKRTSACEDVRVGFDRRAVSPQESQSKARKQMLVALAALSGTRVAFYATAAAVIPVFLLAVAVQLRAGRIFLSGIPLVELFGKHARIAALWVAFVCVCVITAGELLALDALWRDRDESPNAVMLALFIGSLLVLLGTVDAVAEQIRKHTSDRPVGVDTPSRSADG